MHELRVPVLIVGGGLVGLTLSLLLTRHGVPHLLVEQRSGPSLHPRARGLNARSMEVMGALGLDAAVRDAGRDIAASHGILQGASVVAALGAVDVSARAAQKDLFEASGAAWSPTSAARVTQDRLEPVLLAAAKERARAVGARVWLDTTHLQLEQRADAVRCVVHVDEFAADAEFTGEDVAVVADYVVACDGAGSPIRQALGVTTSGAGGLGHLVNVLLRADLADLVRGREPSMIRIDQPGPGEDADPRPLHGLFTSINNRDVWVFHLCIDSPAPGTRVDVAALHLERVVKRVIGPVDGRDVDVSVLRTSVWECAARVADDFRCGRVFFAGDAAHQMPPWGGYGGNSGIADAHNLAWKLAWVLRGDAALALLDTYSDERRPIAVAKAADAAARADTAPGARGLLKVDDKMLRVLAAVTTASRFPPLRPLLRRAMARRAPQLLGLDDVVASAAVLSSATDGGGARVRFVAGEDVIGRGEFSVVDVGRGVAVVRPDDVVAWTTKRSKPAAAEVEDVIARVLHPPPG